MKTRLIAVALIAIMAMSFIAPAFADIIIMYAKTDNGKALIYIYRARELERALGCDGVRQLLGDCGYSRFDVSGALETLKTRLGVMDVCVTCLTPLPSPLGGEPLSSFSLPAWMFGDGLAELESLPKDKSGAFMIEPRQEGGRICFDFGGQTFYYDATGLISEHELESGKKRP